MGNFDQLKSMMNMLGKEPAEAPVKTTVQEVDWVDDDSDVEIDANPDEWREMLGLTSNEEINIDEIYDELTGEDDPLDGEDDPLDGDDDPLDEHEIEIEYRQIWDTFQSHPDTQKVVQELETKGVVFRNTLTKVRNALGGHSSQITFEGDDYLDMARTAVRDKAALTTFLLTLLDNALPIEKNFTFKEQETTKKLTTYVRKPITPSLLKQVATHLHIIYNRSADTSTYQADRIMNLEKQLDFKSSQLDKQAEKHKLELQAINNGRPSVIQTDNREAILVSIIGGTRHYLKAKVFTTLLTGKTMLMPNQCEWVRSIDQATVFPNKEDLLTSLSVAVITSQSDKAVTLAGVKLRDVHAATQCWSYIAAAKGGN